MKTQIFEYSLTEEQASSLIGLSLSTLRSWRTKQTIPDYLYRRFGVSHQQRIRYCQVLLLRWQALDNEADLVGEEMWARKAVIDSLEVKKNG